MSEHTHAGNGADSLDLDRYDLSGKNIRGYTEESKTTFMREFGRLIGRARKHRLQGRTATLADELNAAPSKVLNLAEAKLEEQPITNKLRQSETEKHFSEIELNRIEAEKRKAEIREVNARAEGHELDNELKRVELAERLAKLANGRPLPQIVTCNGEKIVLVARAETPTSLPMEERATDSLEKE